MKRDGRNELGIWWLVENNRIIPLAKKKKIQAILIKENTKHNSENVRVKV